MYIFIGNLPGKKYEPEILSLLKKIDKREKPRIESPILEHCNSGYFCIANIDKEKTAHKFIKKFNNKSPYGHPLNIREFVHRSYGNERRAINWRNKAWDGDEKRNGDRRVFVAQTTLVDNLKSTY